MSYTYKGVNYLINSPVQSISVNKLNIVVRDKVGSQRLKFTNIKDSKRFLAWVYQA